MSASPPLMQLGRFQPIARLGRGGMADAYLALTVGPAGFNKVLVVKTLREEMARDPGLVAMFLDEARLSARLHHPNVVQTYEADESHGRYFLAMEHLQGAPLGRVIRKVPQLDQELRLWIISEVLAGLQYAHELTGLDGVPLGVVHRDVSPSNVMITYDGQVKVLDFGIAKVGTSERAEGKTSFTGKLGYSAPEQLRDENVDRRADLFSVGVLLFETVTGKRLSPNEAVAKKLERTGVRETLLEVAPDFPLELLPICEKALALDPSGRYSTAEEINDELAHLISDGTIRRANRTLSELMGGAFETHRAQLNQLIEERVRLAIARSLDENPRISLIDLPIESIARSPSEQPQRDLDESAAPLEVVPVRRSLPSIPPAHESLTTTRPAPALLRRRARATWVLAASAIVATAGVAVLIARDPSSATVNAATSASSSGGAPVASAANSVKLVLRGEPATAQLLLDGSPLAANPATVSLPRNTRHLLRVEAQGFTTVEREILFDKDEELLVSLRPIHDPSPTDTTVGSPSARPRRAPRRNLDLNDPWK